MRSAPRPAVSGSNPCRSQHSRYLASARAYASIVLGGAPDPSRSSATGWPVRSGQHRSYANICEKTARVSQRPNPPADPDGATRPTPGPRGRRTPRLNRGCGPPPRPDRLVRRAARRGYQRFAAQEPTATPTPNGITEMVIGTGDAFSTGIGTIVPNSLVRAKNLYGWKGWFCTPRVGTTPSSRKTVPSPTPAPAAATDRCRPRSGR
jgi:hypothetical protein